MGTFRVSVELGTPDGARFERLEALVDTGATYTMIPRTVASSLGIEAYRTQMFELADGTLRELELGRTWIRVDDRTELTQVVLADEGMPVLLGAVTLEQMDLAVDPVRRRLVPTNPLLLTLNAA